MALPRCMAVVCLALLAGPLLASAARQLKERVGRESWKDDPSGYNSFAAARVFNQHAGEFPRMALTPENAEDITNPRFHGLYRLANTKDHSVSFATVEPNAVHDNPDRAKQLTRPQARTAQDNPTDRVMDMQSGQKLIPTIAMGNAALAQTFEGATAVAASDSVLTNMGDPSRRRTGTTTAFNMLTSNAPAVKARSGRNGADQWSYAAGTASEPVRSMALSGDSGGKIVLAQAEQAVAMSQAGHGRSDSWQVSGRTNSWRERNGA